MIRNNLSEIHILDWSKEELELLKESLLYSFNDSFNLETNIIKDIYLAGSRVYKIKDRKNFFSIKSDLDVVIIIYDKEFDKYFLPYSDNIISKVYHNKIKNMEENKGKFKPQIKGYWFRNIQLSIFITKNSLYKPYNLLFYKKWALPYYSLYENKYYTQNKYDVIDYLVNIKNRIEPNEFCWLCYDFKESNYILDIRPVDIYENRKMLQKCNQIRLCKECFDKIFNTYETFNIVDLIRKNIN